MRLWSLGAGEGPEDRKKVGVRRWTARKTPTPAVTGNDPAVRPEVRDTPSDMGKDRPPRRSKYNKTQDVAA